MVRSRNSILVLILAVTATGIMGNTLLAPAIPDILDEFGVSDSGAGLLIAAASFPGIIMAPIIGILADRLGRRNVIVPCLAAFGTFGVVAALAPSYTVLLLARLGMGLGAAGLINLAVVLIGDYWEGTDRTRLIGRNAAFLTLCLALFPPIGGALTQAVSWRLALAPYSLAILTALFAWRRLPADKPDHPVPLREQLGGLGQVARRPELLLVFFAAMVAFVLIFGVFLSTFPIHLRDEFGYDAAIRGLFLAIPALTSTIIAFNLQRIREVLGTRRMLVGAALMFALGYALIGANHMVWLVVLGGMVYGLGEGAMIPMLQDRSVSLAPPEHRGAVVALFVGSARLGQTIGPIGAAVLFSATSTYTALHAGIALAVGLALLFHFTPMTQKMTSDDG